MGLGAIHDDVVFDHAGADELMRQLRLTADLLDEHRLARPAIDAEARTDWQGVYADQFDADQRTAANNAVELAAALRLAANGLGELAAAAEREQQRREDARAWQKQQDDRAWYETAADNVSDFFTGDDDIPKPPPPDDPPRYISEAVSTAR